MALSYARIWEVASDERRVASREGEKKKRDGDGKIHQKRLRQCAPAHQAEGLSRLPPGLGTHKTRGPSVALRVSILVGCGEKQVEDSGKIPKCATGPWARGATLEVADGEKKYRSLVYGDQYRFYWQDPSSENCPFAAIAPSARPQVTIFWFRGLFFKSSGEIYVMDLPAATS